MAKRRVTITPYSLLVIGFEFPRRITVPPHSAHCKVNEVIFNRFRLGFLVSREFIDRKEAAKRDESRFIISRLRIQHCELEARAILSKKKLQMIIDKRLYYFVVAGARRMMPSEDKTVGPGLSRKLTYLGHRMFLIIIRRSYL